ncbi:MAG: gamma-glutamyltransferase, partial [Chloroflexi bacterium]
MHGVIAAGHPQTAEAGAEILKMGGNAVDAAVAAAFASFVAESALVNIGGGGIAQIFNPATGQATVYDFFSTMPGLTNGKSPAPPAKQMDFKKVLVDFGAAVQPFYIGRGSVAVPGVVAGLCQMLADAGTLPLSTVLQPAITEARNGVLVTEAQRYIIHLLTPILTDTPGIAAIYAPNGQIVQAGSTLCFPNLAETLEQLGQEGTSLFYTGRVAQQILQDQRQHGGLLTPTDLQTYRVFSRRPIPVQYRDYTILLPPPSSSGGVLIAFALKLLASALPAGLAHNGFEHLRLLTEVMRLTSAARAGWEDELEQTDDPAALAAAFLSDENLRGYRQKLQAVLAGKAPQAEAPAKKGPSNTTHLSVADANGMLAAVTTSAGECSGFVVEGTGVKLNN